jgi:hypothetical protein
MEGQTAVRFLCLFCRCQIQEAGVDLFTMTHTVTQYYPNGVTVKNFQRHPVRVEWPDTREAMTEADMDAMATYYGQVIQ